MRKDKLELLYSAGVLIAVPLLVALNTILLINSTRQAYNNELKRKADVVNAVIAEMTEAKVAEQDYDGLTDTLNDLEASQPSITRTSILQIENNTVTIVARSTNAATELSPGDELQAKIANDRKVPVAKLISVQQGSTTSQGWNVVTPALSDDGEVLAIVSSTFLTTDAEETINKAFTTSFIVLIASIIVIMLLLFRHFRLVGYIQLLAKQREINQTMSDFLSVATHELKAPASIIKGYVSNVMDGTFGPVSDEINEQLQVAVSQTDRLNTLVQDLLNVSRIEQGRIEYTITDVDTTALLTMITNNYKPLAAEKNLSVIYLPTQPLPLVKADAGRLQEIFTNLIDNAIKYTAEGSVTVTQTKVGNTLVTAIKDTGFGMSAEARKRLFQRFYRVKTDQTKNISGTGLGLWIIKQYTEAMGGSIEVNSMEGSGSEFIVTMPVA